MLCKINMDLNNKWQTYLFIFEFEQTKKTEQMP